MRFLICLSEKLPVLNELCCTWRVHVCDLLNRFRQPATFPVTVSLPFGRERVIVPLTACVASLVHNPVRFKDFLLIFV